MRFKRRMENAMQNALDAAANHVLEFRTESSTGLECAMSSIAVFCTCPDEATAERVADALVNERLAACVNRIAGVTSTYRWKGTLQRDSEQLLIIKTARDRFDALRERIVALHPYEIPEVIAVDVAAGLDRYLDWIVAETRD